MYRPRTLTERLVRMVRSRPIEADALVSAERAVRDWLGSMVAGTRTAAGGALLRYGRGARDPGTMAFLAAALSHITETDDLHRGSVTHPGCAVVPVALVAGRGEGVGGARVLAAVLHGYEVMIRVGEALGPGHYRIFHNTATAGVFGSAAATASVLGLDDEEWVWALGNAGTQASGLWQFNADATMSKHLHAGHAAEAGLRAALLAREGFTGPSAILEGERGFFRGFCPDPVPERVAAESDGWKLLETSYKPYPSCRHTHPAIDAALALRSRVVSPDAWTEAGARVEIDTYPAALDLTDNSEPASPYAARFSIQYCVARALAHGPPDLGAFDMAAMSDPAVQSLLGKTTVRTDPALTAAYPERWGARVILTTGTGERFVSLAPSARGDPEAPMSDTEIDDKVRGLLRYGGLDETRAAAILGACRTLPNGGPVFALPWIEDGRSEGEAP